MDCSSQAPLSRDFPGQKTVFTLSLTLLKQETDGLLGQIVGVVLCGPKLQDKIAGQSREKAETFPDRI